MHTFAGDISRSLIVAATLAAASFGSLAFAEPAQARDSFSFAYADGRSGLSIGVSDRRGRDHWDRRDRRERWDHRHHHRGHHHRGDRWDRRDDRRHYTYAPRYYYPPRYRYVAPPPYYYYPQPYYYGY